MKIMWCWRCKADVPMLDKDEYESISRIHSDCIRSVKKYREENGVALKDVPFDEIYQPLKREYERLTGMADCHHDTIMHHRISLYGPPCKQCGKPLRTLRAKYCAFCGKGI